MSQEKVEIIRSANEAFNRRDIEGFLAFCDDGLEIEDFSNAPDVPRVSRGLAEARALFKAWVDAFDDFRGEIVEFIEVGNRVACVVEYSGINRTTGLTVNQTAVDVWEFRGHKLLRGRIGYTDRAEALEAASPSKQDAHADS